MGYNHQHHEAGAGCGGIATILAPKWAKLVAESGTVMTNRAHWIVLIGLSGGDLGILNIYALDESHLRSRLWEALITQLSTTCQWVIAGDFNMVELHHDKTNPCGKMIPVGERILFDSLKQHLSLEEGPRSEGSLRFSWNNHRTDGLCIFARLDRFYVFKLQIV